MRFARNHRPILFAIVVLFTGLVFLLPACNLSGPTQTDFLATQTAIASQILPLLTPVASSFTPTLAISLTPTLTATPAATLTLAPGVGITSTYATPVPGQSFSYTLKKGEFPYCIARRFNVHPNDLLTVNGLLGSYRIYPEGLVLTVPGGGRPFPGLRALLPHPATYTVPQSQMTVYKVACLYGDVDPQVILQHNGLTSPFLTLGQTLQIP